MLQENKGTQTKVIKRAKQCQQGENTNAILAKRVTTYTSMLENNYSNTSVQKGGLPGVQGCLEHTSVLTKTIQEVKAKTGDLTVMW